jgi:hypothetical protein
MINLRFRPVLVLFIFALFTMGFSSQAALPQLVPVSGFEARRVSGECTDYRYRSECHSILETQFVVPVGGSCYRYKARIVLTRNARQLYIFQSKIDHCTRPEILNYTETLEIEFDADDQCPLKLGNPVYILDS